MNRATLRAMRHYLAEGATSLTRGWRTSVLSLATIVAAVFVLGAVLLVSSTVERALDRWSRSAGLSVFLEPSATDDARRAIERALAEHPRIAGIAFVTAEAAAERFARSFPDLASLAVRPGAPVLPASFEARVRPEGGEVEIQALADRLARLPGVADVSYDRGLIDRLSQMARVGRAVAFVLVAVLALAAGLAVVSVVGLSYVARRDDVEVLTLVGAPLGAIRGPFVAEGWLQATAGAVIACLLLAGGFLIVRGRYGAAMASSLGLERLEFLAPATWIAMLVVSGVLGAAAGAVAVSRRIADLS
jgi:cell division transport system permease protein